MNTRLAEEHFLKAWAHEEINSIAGEAHKLQEEYGAESSELAARFRAWAEHNRLDPVAVSRLLDDPVPGAVSWPWASDREHHERVPSRHEATVENRRDAKLLRMFKANLLLRPR